MKPPEEEYAPPPNLPPACSSVSTTSSAETLRFLCLPTGILTVIHDFHRPITVQDNINLVTKPCSSLINSIVNQLHRRCVSPSLPVPPMYIPGRLRTASKPSKVWIASASYFTLFVFVAAIMVWTPPNHLRISLASHHRGRPTSRMRRSVFELTRSRFS